MKEKKTLFFGWTNFKWFMRNLLAMWSDGPSYFSKKRVESNLAFLGGFITLLLHVYLHWNKIGNSEMIADVTILFLIAGYTVGKIEEAKLNKPKEEAL